MSLITRACRSKPVRPSFIFRTQIKRFLMKYLSFLSSLSDCCVFPLFFQPLYKFLNILPLFYCLSLILLSLSNLSFFAFIFLLILNLIFLYPQLFYYFSSLLFLSGCKIGLRSVCNTLNSQNITDKATYKIGLVKIGRVFSKEWKATKNGCSPPNDVRFL